jgi:sensor histidine kinase YesM
MRFQAELKALQSQVNPHFLFNTLNSLVSLISPHPEKAEELTMELSELLRQILGASSKGWWTIEEEVALISSYLNIESVRLGDQLTYSIEVEPALYRLDIPCLIIEPLVENAIQHGINSSISGGEITLGIKEDQGLKIIVEDKITANEQYPRSPAPTGEHIGLKNIKKRLNLIYGGTACFKLETHDFGARASITIENVRKFKHGKI